MIVTSDYDRTSLNTNELFQAKHTDTNEQNRISVAEDDHNLLNPIPSKILNNQEQDNDGNRGGIRESIGDSKGDGIRDSNGEIKGDGNSTIQAS